MIVVQSLNCPEAKLGLHIFEYCEANSDVQSMQGAKELTQPAGLLSTAVIYELYGSFMLSENVNGYLIISYEKSEQPSSVDQEEKK